MFTLMTIGRTVALSRIAAQRLPIPSQAHQLRVFCSSNCKPKSTAKPSFLYSSHGLITFANLPFHPVLSSSPQSSSSVPSYDIAILGAPFDLGTTHRPGSRFGPQAIRKSSQAIHPAYNYSAYTKTNLFTHGPIVIDVGDALLTNLDKDAALAQLTQAHKTISTHHPPTKVPSRIVTLGGDHLTTLAALRSTTTHWGPTSIIHFDAHIDTWDPATLSADDAASFPTPSAGVNHGTFLHIAHEEGLLQPDASIHLGIRAPLSNAQYDWDNDVRCGFETLTARDIDQLGVHGVVERVKRRVGQNNAYVSVDIDVLDPAFAPGTGTPEVGGWSTRELLSVLDGLRGLKVVGADVVEVAPAYDGPGEITALAAAEVVVSLLGLMVEVPAEAMKV